MTDAKRQPHLGQVAPWLFVDAALVADAPGQDPGDPGSRDRGRSGLVDPTADLDQADEGAGDGRQGVDAQSLRGRLDPFIGIQNEIPVRVGPVERRVTGGREVVAPDKGLDLGSRLGGYGGGRVGRAGVDHDHAVDQRPGAGQSPPDPGRFVARNHHQGEACHLSLRSDRD